MNGMTFSMGGTADIRERYKVVKGGTLLARSAFATTPFAARAYFLFWNPSNENSSCCLWVYCGTPKVLDVWSKSIRGVGTHHGAMHLLKTSMSTNIGQIMLWKYLACYLHPFQAVMKQHKDFASLQS
jgi:hypothetical protein